MIGLYYKNIAYMKNFDYENRLSMGDLQIVVDLVKSLSKHKESAEEFVEEIKVLRSKGVEK